MVIHLNIYICDDSNSDLLRLKHHIHTYMHLHGLEYTLYEFHSSKELLSYYTKNSVEPDLIFLDIYMDQPNGMETAKYLYNHKCNASIIFTTSSVEHAIESYSVHAKYYLHKPYTHADFQNAMDACINLFIMHKKKITVTSERQEKQIPLDRILYIESGNHCSYLYTKDATIKASKTISDMQKILAKEDTFCTCGKSYLINMSQIDSYNSELITLVNGIEIPIPVRLKRQVTNQIYEFRITYGISTS